MGSVDVRILFWIQIFLSISILNVREDYPNLKGNYKILGFKFEGNSSV